MTEKSSVPVIYWVIAAIALIWNLMGLYAFYADMTMTPESLAAMEEAQRGL
tara:strand:- start:150 stop:302 length:153 start_codon:yes stop_codon:yes gene_type:complete